MRCKKHLPDLTSTVGVCASCLRDRLQPLVEAQSQAQTQAQSARPSSDGHHRSGKPELHPPPLDLPPSVSPYVNRRQERLFQTTPQVGPGFSTACDGGAASSKRRLGRFWILSGLFRPRSSKTEYSSSRGSCEPPSSSSSASPALSSSWYSTIVPARRQNDQRRCRQPDPSESPKIDGSDTSESSPQRRQQQTATVARRSRLGPAGKSLTSIAFCLSPLVRASPNRRLSHHKGLAQELGSGGPQHISTAVSYCANRSRKLSDFGRVSHNNR